MAKASLTADVGDQVQTQWPLLSEHSGAFLRLCKLLSGKQGFTLCFLTFSDSAYRDKVAELLAHRLHARVCVTIDPEKPIGTEELFIRLNKGKRAYRAQLFGMERWPDGLDNLLTRLNHRRDALEEICQRPLLFWVPSRKLNLVATHAADLWAWRSGVFAFALSKGPKGVESLHRSRIPFTSKADEAKRRTRIGSCKTISQRVVRSMPMM